MQNKTIAIIGAMDCEINRFKSLLKDSQTVSYNNLKLYTGKIYNHNVIVCHSGVGKVASALNTQFLTDKYNPDFIINTGVAGAVSEKLQVGDIVIGESFIQYDFDATALGYTKGYMCTGIEPQKPTVFYSDKELSEKYYRVIKDSNTQTNVYKGIIGTADKFLSSSEQKQELKTQFNIIAVDMESAAICQTANTNNVKCLIVRAISDLADGTAKVTLSQLESKMAEFASSTVDLLLKNL